LVAATDELEELCADLMDEIKALLRQAKDASDELQFDQAQDLIVKALEQDANYAPSYEILGEVFVEQDALPQARTAFQKAIELDAQGDDVQSGFGKYLWLAQLSEEGGMESLRYYKAGVKRLIAHIASLPEDQQPPLRARLASAYSAMAELFMTDLCMEADAEANCEKYVTNALLADESSSEALQTLASMRLSQQRVEEARTALRHSLSLWQDADGEPGILPAYASRIALVRLLLECDMTDESLDVLQQLSREDDESVDLWYLFGWTYFLAGELLQAKDPKGSTEQRDEHWEDARHCLQKCEQLYKRLEWDDDGIREHASELLACIAEAGIPLTEAPEEAGPEEAEDWESEDDAMDE
jgi:Tfp pilus assembly protein PilF